MVKGDIADFDEVKQMVDRFYFCAMKDDLLGPVFSQHLSVGMPQHLEKMYSFWHSLLFGSKSYSGRPFPPHIQLPIERKHFKRWLKLFEIVVDESFVGPKAEEAKSRAKAIATVFEVKLEDIKNKHAF